ncbi:MAG TPA: hypothetical protein GXX61_05425 [Bacteroidales bacterium]|jgi:hypothetical protein|nr:hypothetical protein [Bacteroidales bacterium]
MKKTIIYVSLILVALLAAPACEWLWEFDFDNSDWEELCEEYDFLNMYPSFDFPFKYLSYFEHDVSNYESQNVNIRTQIKNADKYLEVIKAKNYTFYSENEGVTSYIGPKVGNRQYHVNFQHFDNKERNIGFVLITTW